MKPLVKCLAMGVLTISVFYFNEPAAVGGMIASVEAAGAQSTNVAGAFTETFDAASPGNYMSLNTLVGTLSTTGSFEIQKANLYGGAAGTGNYLAIGNESGSSSPLTLTFNGPQSFFGMWWSAADANNTISFYSGSTLLETFTANSLFGSLSSAYYGNPTTNFAGQDSGEKFAYVNFFANGGPDFTSVVFGNSNSLSTGFEMDNFSVAMVPEPSSMLLGMTGAAFIALAWLRGWSRKRPPLVSPVA